MPEIHEPSYPDLYRTVKDRNLEQQYFLLQTIVEVGISHKGFQFTPDILYSLHTASATFLDQTPGRVRTDFNHIENSSHVPPPPTEIEKHLKAFFSYLNDNFNERSTFHLAAYALWMIVWIHPFNECNGRTARAFSYLIICLKEGLWLPGNTTIHTLISEKLSEYYQLLAEADASLTHSGEFDISGLERYLAQLTFAQIELPPDDSGNPVINWICRRFCAD